MSEPTEQPATAVPNGTAEQHATPVAADAPTEKSTDVKSGVEEKPSTAGNAETPVATNKTPSDDKEHSQSEKTTPVKAPIQQLWSLAKAHDHSEIWGVQLADPDTHVPSQIVLQKYLNANDGDLTKAQDQLTKTLDWRKQNKPLELMKQHFDSGKFAGLGYVTTYGTVDPSNPEAKEVFTWNVYGIVKDIDKTFGDLKEFVNWRVALMELALQSLSIATATKPITADWDPYKIYQVHDYKSVSFFRQNPKVKSAVSEIVKTFALVYPELLKEKFFVNVPAIMGAVYALIKLVVAKKTAKKFHPMSNGGALAQEFGDSKLKGLGEMLPKEYGGKGEELSVKGTSPETNAP